MSGHDGHIYSRLCSYNVDIVLHGLQLEKHVYADWDYLLHASHGPPKSMAII